MSQSRPKRKVKVVSVEYVKNKAFQLEMWIEEVPLRVQQTKVDMCFQSTRRLYFGP